MSFKPESRISRNPGERLRESRAILLPRPPYDLKGRRDEERSAPPVSRNPSFAGMSVIGGDFFVNYQGE